MSKFFPVYVLHICRRDYRPSKENWFLKAPEFQAIERNAHRNVEHVHDQAGHAEMSQ